MTPRENLLGRPWTARELRILRRHLVSRGTAYVAERLGRSPRAVRLRAGRLGISRRPKWNDITRRRLRNLWGEYSLRYIAEKVGHSQLATFKEGRRLRLPTIPEGMESIKSAERRTGFSWSTMRRIFAWAGVELHWPIRRPSRKPRRDLCVDVFEVDQAVEAWLSTEVLHVAARSRGHSSEWLERRLRGGEGVPKKPGRKVPWRIPTVVIDRALAGKGRRAA